MHNGNGVGQRAGTLHLNSIHLSGVTVGNAVLLRYCWQLVGSSKINELFRTDLELDVHVMDNIKNANYSLGAAQIHCELSVGTALSTCYRRLTCINISLDSVIIGDRQN